MGTQTEAAFPPRDGEPGLEQRLRALAHPVRQQVLERLAHSNASAGDLQRELALSSSALSQHLKQLLDAELVHRKRRGPHLDYGLSPEGLREVADWLQELWRLRLDGKADERYRRSVLEEFLGQDPPRSLPRHPLKRELVAAHFGQQLESGEFYPAAELEERLREECRDWEDLLAAMKNLGLIEGNGQYWLRKEETG